MKRESVEVTIAPRLAWHFFALLCLLVTIAGAVGGYIGTTLALHH